MKKINDCLKFLLALFNSNVLDLMSCVLNLHFPQFPILTRRHASDFFELGRKVLHGTVIQFIRHFTPGQFLIKKPLLYFFDFEADKIFFNCNEVIF